MSTSTEAAPECCPFCGSEPLTEGEEKWSSEIGKYRCGTISHAFEPDDRWQTSQCRIAERERLTRKRDEAFQKLTEMAFKAGELTTRVQRLEEAGDAMAADDQCHPHLMEQWEKAKEATP